MVKPTLYIIMRTDIPDMNPGKACAQAAHAQADFDSWINSSNPDYYLNRDIGKWKEDRSFGRTIVLEATKAELSNVCLSMHTVGRVIVDPTYPWKNWYGKTFLSEEITCGWVFVYDNWAIHNPDTYKRIKAIPLMM